MKNQSLNGIIQTLFSRLPDRKSLVSVYAVIVFLVFNWTLVNFIWKVSSWLFYLNLGQVVSLYAYSLVFDFIESGLLLAGVMLVSLILPASWWKSKFVPRSAALLIVVMGALILNAFEFRDPSLQLQFVGLRWVWWAATFGVALPLVWLAGRVHWIRRALEDIADRCIIFLIIYMPLTMLAIVTVLVRAVL